MAKSIRDMMALTGRTHATVVNAIESGQCPGYKVGNTYTIPDTAFDLFERGYWEPVTARITKIQPAHPLVRRRSLKEAASTD